MRRNDREAATPQVLTDQLGNQGLARRIERSGGLVEEPDASTADEKPGEREPPLLARRHMPRLDVLEPAEAHARQRVRSFSSGRPHDVAPEAQVLDDGELAADGVVGGEQVEFRTPRAGDATRLRAKDSGEGEEQ